jgi:hypothetical protein
MEGRNAMTTRECELLLEITAVIHTISQSLDAFLIIRDLDELNDELTAHHERLRTLMAEFRRLRSERA